MSQTNVPIEGQGPSTVTEPETKFLRLQGQTGNIINEYKLELEFPAKQDLLSMLERPPHFILTTNELTFTTGCLGQVAHSVKLLVSREYQDPYVGVFIDVAEKPDQYIRIQDIKGHFQFEFLTPTQDSTPRNETNNNGVELLRRHLRLQQPHANANNADGLQVLGNVHHHTPHFNANIGGRLPPLVQVIDHQLPTGVFRTNGFHQVRCTHFPNPSVSYGTMTGTTSFNFIQSKSTRFVELPVDNYTYYESHCHNWPIVPSKMKIVIRVVKLNFSTIVSNDDVNTSGSTSRNKETCIFDHSAYFLSENLSDVQIKIGSTTTIPAHKLILSARSEYFKAMFSNSMRESVEGIVQISDVDEQHIKELLRFIYTGKVENMDKVATDLFLLGDKYQVEDLMEYCEDHLLTKLSVENAVEMYDISHTVGRKGTLARKSKELLMWNREKFASDLDGFKEFFNKYPDLVFEFVKLGG